VTKQKRCPYCNKFTDRWHNKKPQACGACLQKAKKLHISSSRYRFMKNLLIQLRYSREKQGHTFTLIPEDLYELWDEQEGRCALSGIPMTFNKSDGGEDTNVSIDRIKPKGLYVRKNIQLVAKKVNLLKHTLEENELIDWVDKIYGHKILNK
tara:strand:+ start:829 stop:1284 length:456 start_codon:yes stop_codon:yes gene_type:complete